MTQRNPSRSGKAGLPPGSLVHIGQRRADAVCITRTRYTEDRLDTEVLTTLDGIAIPEDPAGVTWINVEGLHDTTVLEDLGKRFGLHALILEDILVTEQRPKLEDYGDYLFIVLRTFTELRETVAMGQVGEQVGIILGKGFVLSFWERENPLLKPLRDRLSVPKTRIRKSGADYLAYSLMDSIVDSYFTLLESQGEAIAALEDLLVGTPTRSTLKTLQSMKREITYLRKSVWPLRETISTLERSESPLLNRSTGLYLRDLYDHTVHVIDTIETYRDILAGMTDIYLSSISHRTNEIMRVLTVLATFFMPLTFLAGVYGMNFEFMPELKWRWGYPAFWLVTLAIAATMILFFRRKKWF